MCVFNLQAVQSRLSTDILVSHHVWSTFSYDRQWHYNRNFQIWKTMNVKSVLCIKSVSTTISWSSTTSPVQFIYLFIIPSILEYWHWRASMQCSVPILRNQSIKKGCHQRVVLCGMSLLSVPNDALTTGKPLPEIQLISPQVLSHEGWTKDFSNLE